MERHLMKDYITKNNKLINVLFYFLGVLLLVVVWSIISIIKNNFLYPSIIEISEDIFSLLGEIDTYKVILLTLLKLIIVISISYLLSFIFAYFAFKYNLFRKIISPIILVFRSIPVASVIIILILLVGLKYAPIIITMLVIVPICYESFYLTFKDIDKDVIDETRLVSNINIIIVLRLFIPMQKNFIISSLLQTTGLSLKVLVMGEILTQGSNTIGGKIQFARSALDVTRVFSWTTILLILVLILELGINIINNKYNK